MLVGGNFVVKTEPEGEAERHGNLLKCGWTSAPVPDLNADNEMASEPGRRLGGKK